MTWWMSFSNLTPGPNIHPHSHRTHPPSQSQHHTRKPARSEFTRKHIYMRHSPWSPLSDAFNDTDGHKKQCFSFCLLWSLLWFCSDNIVRCAEQSLIVDFLINGCFSVLFAKAMFSSDAAFISSEPCCTLPPHGSKEKISKQKSFCFRNYSGSIWEKINYYQL